MLSPDPTHAFDSLYIDHHGWLRNWLGKKLGNASDAADLAHDTYVRILEAGTRPAQDQSRRYLTRVANCLLIDLYRRRRIESAYLDALALRPAPETPSEETRALIIEALIEIDTILNALPPRARAALLMCKLEGLSYRDIAERLGVSVPSIEKDIAKALCACYSVMFEAQC